MGARKAWVGRDFEHVTPAAIAHACTGGPLLHTLGVHEIHGRICRLAVEDGVTRPAHERRHHVCHVLGKNRLAGLPRLDPFYLQRLWVHVNYVHHHKVVAGVLHHEPSYLGQAFAGSLRLATLDYRHVGVDLSIRKRALERGVPAKKHRIKPDQDQPDPSCSRHAQFLRYALVLALHPAQRLDSRRQARDAPKPGWVRTEKSRRSPRRPLPLRDPCCASLQTHSGPGSHGTHPLFAGSLRPGEFRCCRLRAPGR